MRRLPTLDSLPPLQVYGPRAVHLRVLLICQRLLTSVHVMALNKVNRALHLYLPFSFQLDLKSLRPGRTIEENPEAHNSRRESKEQGALDGWDWRERNECTFEATNIWLSATSSKIGYSTGRFIACLKLLKRESFTCTATAEVLVLPENGSISFSGSSFT